MDIGIVPLTGTNSDLHMKQDLAVLSLEPLSIDQIESIKKYMV